MSEYTGFFWTEQVWLPPNTTWSDLVNDPGKGEQVNYRRVSDLWFPIPAAIAIIMLRAWLEKNVFKPFGIYLGLSSKSPRPPATNPALEDVYRNLIDVKSKIPDDVIQKLAKKLEMSDRQVERWLRRRRAIDRPTILDKFAETGWRFVFLFCSWSQTLFAGNLDFPQIKKLKKVCYDVSTMMSQLSQKCENNAILIQKYTQRPFLVVLT